MVTAAHPAPMWKQALHVQNHMTSHLGEEHHGVAAGRVGAAQGRAAHFRQVASRAAHRIILNKGCRADSRQVLLFGVPGQQRRGLGGFGLQGGGVHVSRGGGGGSWQRQELRVVWDAHNRPDEPPLTCSVASSGVAAWRWTGCGKEPSSTGCGSALAGWAARRMVGHPITLPDALVQPISARGIRRQGGDRGNRLSSRCPGRR